MNSALFCVVALAAVVGQADQDSLRVIPKGSELRPASRLRELLLEQVRAAAAQRREKYEALKTSEQCETYQREVRDFFRQQIGGLPSSIGDPEQRPAAEVVGTLDGDGFRVEKIIYESRPRHHVTAALFLPTTPGPHPAVLIACGHTKTGKGAEYNQRMAIALAKHGIAAMCYDPIGQGERSQILTEDGSAKYSASTTEHFLVGVGSILVGRGTATYRIVDGLRGIDYLCGRSDIDAERIGCTGCSGGGTLTSYLMALDERVACAAPSCYLTTFEQLLTQLGPQDSEQNIFGQVAFGMDHADYVLMRAPRPTLICSTTRDFFPIAGAWDTFRQAKRFYGRLGFPERVDLVEIDSTHGVPRPSREAMVRWMRRWLLNRDDAVTEPDFDVFRPEQLWCTPDGEVLRLDGERSVFDLNLAEAERLAQTRQTKWNAATAPERREAVRNATGIRPLHDVPAAIMEEFGSVERDGIRIDKLLLTTDDGMLLPTLRFVPGEPQAGSPVLYLHGGGKTTDAGPDGPIARWVKAGKTVWAVDLRGFGETAVDGKNDLLGSDWKEFYTAYLLGKSFVQMRAEDVLAAQRAIVGGASSTQTVALVAKGDAVIPALHAAALEPQCFASVEFDREPMSWMAILRTNEPRDECQNVVHNSLAVYDLPDLMPLTKSAKQD